LQMRIILIIIYNLFAISTNSKGITDK